MSKRIRKSAIWIVGFYLVLFSICQKWILAQDLMCCAHATGSCRNVCERISLVDLAADTNLRNETVLDVQKYCSPQHDLFWECLNATFKDMSRGENWSGRFCCKIPNSESCRKACITAVSRSDLVQSCRQSDEIAFFTCLDRQRDGDICCGNARTDECKEACLDIFRSQVTPSDTQREKIKVTCEQTSPGINGCIKDLVQLTPVNWYKKTYCCDMTNKNKCREACRKVLSTKNTVQEIMDGIEHGGCGPFRLQEYLWQCLMKSSDSELAASTGESRISKFGIDSAKWHCCQRANSPYCQRLCSKTFTKSWFSSWLEFKHKCLKQISEENLRNCIDEVEEPCELGCDGLSFCTNFNNRPTELFRSCSPPADEAARNDVTYWKNQNEFKLLGLTLPLRDSPKCSPSIWQAIACILEIRPCSRHSHTNQICRADCLEILSECVNWSETDLDQSADTICEGLSPEGSNDSCISIQHFVNPSEKNYQRITTQVSSPCKGDLCESNEVCMVNNNCNYGGVNCRPYTCVKSCKLGEGSDYQVPEGTYVRIPIPNNPKGCLQICQCSDGQLQQCQPLICITLTSCLYGNYQHLHGSSFKIDCNHCSCFAGEVICSKKQCENSALSGRNTAYTTLPCNCPPHYVPVCGSNGNSYSSACLAKCAMLTDSNIDVLPCQDPCKTNKCPVGHKCVPNSQVCLSLKHKPCTQFICVNGTTNCGTLPKEPVCDIENRQFLNMCFLAHENAKLAYKGPCLRGCNSRGQVCGINGRTYISECASFADMVSVDYLGPCLAVGLITNTKNVQCPNVECPRLPHSNCLGITPPGACCPLCGGTFRLLYSTKQIDRALYALQNQSAESLTLRSLLKGLGRQIQVAQCVLRGYLTVESDIFVAVQSTERNPTELQLEACVREAEKLANLINIQSSRIVSELSLSSLTFAQLTTSSSASLLVVAKLLIVMMLLLIYLK